MNRQTLLLEHVTIDLSAFRALVASGDPQDWRAAIELYGGEVLADLDAEWLLSGRTWYHDLYLTTLARLCTTLVETGQWADALTYTDRWRLADPFNEEAYRTSMRINARLGRHAVALKQYDRLVHLLDDELLTFPLLETRRLADAIRAEYAEGSEYGANALPPPLVERQAERSRLLRLIEAAQKGLTTFVLVEGESGIGKTRLLEAVAESASWRGIAIAWARAPAYRQTPYIPLLSALETALAGPRAAVVSASMGAAEARLLTPFIVPPQARVIGSQPTPAMLASIEEASIAEATVVAFQALCRIQPHLLLLDDVQLADTRFWRLLHSSAPRLHNLGLVVILSYRDAELRANHIAWEILCALDRECNIERLGLAHLSLAGCQKLVETLGAELNLGLAADLHRQTGGNPLLIRELISATRDHTAFGRIAGYFDQRLAHCPPGARMALEVAAVLGESFGFQLWHTLVGGQLPAMLPALLAERYLVEHEQGYRFFQTLLRDQLYATVEPQRRHAIHTRAAVELADQGIDFATAGWHFAQATAWPKALHCYLEAASQAQSRHDYAAAARLYARAVEIARLLPDCADTQLKLLMDYEHAQAAAQEQTRLELLGTMIVYLASTAAPLGRPLNTSERVAVRWTLDAGRADQTLLERDGKVALRRHRIVRLLDEARQQGAAATTADLANVLGVTERTIVADLATLRAQGALLFTRRYKTR